MKSQDTKSSDQLKKEVDQQIRKVKNDLDALQGRLTPGQLIDDAIFYPHGRSLSSTIDHLKRNPVGTTFLSLGTILLMEDENHNTMEWNARSRVTTLKDSVTSVKQAIQDQLPHKDLGPGMAPSKGDIAKGKITSMKETVKEKVSDLKDKLPSKEELKAKVATTKDTVSDQVSGVKDTVSSKVGDMKEGVSTKFDDIQNRFGVNDTGSTEESNFSFTKEDVKEGIRDKASGIYSQGKERIQNLDPLTYMALGAGLGALTGAALPVSEKESTFVHGKFDEKLGGLGSDLQEAINESSNILKDLVINDIKDYSFKPFR